MCAYAWKFVAVVIHRPVVLSHTVVVLDCLPLFTLTLFISPPFVSFGRLFVDFMVSVLLLLRALLDDGNVLFAAVNRW